MNKIAEKRIVTNYLYGKYPVHAFIFGVFFLAGVGTLVLDVVFFPAFNIVLPLPTIVCLAAINIFPIGVDVYRMRQGYISGEAANRLKESLEG